MNKQNKALPMPLTAHLYELRSRLFGILGFSVVALLLCYTLRTEIYDIMTAPLAEAMVRAGVKPSLIATSLLDGFVGMLGLVFAAAFLLTLPYVGVQVWLFISPALYAKERRPALAIMLLTPMLFSMGVVFCYYLVLPNAIYFLATFVDSADLETPLLMMPRMTDYLNLSKALLGAFGLAFLFPLALVALTRAGVVTKDWLARGRKYAVVLIFIASAMLTPPDVASQILLAVPLIIMYEIAILFARKIET